MQETIKSFLPTQTVGHENSDSQPSSSVGKQIIIDNTKESIKPFRRARDLGSIVLCGIYLTAGYLGAGLVDKLSSQDLLTKASQSLKEKLLLALQDTSESSKVDVLPAQLSSDPATTEVKHAPYKVVVKSALVRNAPNVEAKIVGSLNLGTIIIGLTAGLDEQWIKVSEDQYVSRSLVERVSNPSGIESDLAVASDTFSAPKLDTSKTLWIVDPKLAVYDKADVLSPILKQLPYATKLKGHTVQGGKWFKLDSGGFVEREKLGETKPFLTFSDI
jgi:hypothetical protein